MTLRTARILCWLPLTLGLTLLLLPWGPELPPLLYLQKIRWSGYGAILCLLASLSVRVFDRFKNIPKALLTTFRRSLGISSAVLATAHLLLIGQFSPQAPTLLKTMTANLWLQLGSACWLILLFLWATSYPSITRRLQVREWKALHRLAYLAGLLAVLHLLLSPWAGVKVVLLLIVVFICLMLLRL